MPKYNHTFRDPDDTGRPEMYVTVYGCGEVSLNLSADDAEALINDPYGMDADDVRHAIGKVMDEARVEYKSYSGTVGFDNIGIGLDVVYDVTVAYGATSIKVERRAAFGPFMNETLTARMIEALTEAQAVVAHNRAVVDESYS